MHEIPCALGCSAYLSVWREVGALCVERLVVFVPSLPTLCFPLCISVMGACFSRGHGGSWLGCQVLPAIGAVSILELAANSGSSRMSQASNLQRVTRLFTTIDLKSFSHFVIDAINWKKDFVWYNSRLIIIIELVISNQLRTCLI